MLIAISYIGFGKNNDLEQKVEIIDTKIENKFLLDIITTGTALKIVNGYTHLTKMYLIAHEITQKELKEIKKDVAVIIENKRKEEENKQKEDRRILYQKLKAEFENENV